MMSQEVTLPRKYVGSISLNHIQDRDLPGFENLAGLIDSSPYSSQTLCGRIAAIKAMKRHWGHPIALVFRE